MILRTVLAVDDDPAITDSIKLILEDQYTILKAHSGEEALKRIAENEIGLVFLDILMPGGMDGFEVLKRVKASGENITVIMVTASNTASMAVRAMKLGAFDYITKPFNPDEISITAAKAFENHDLRKDIVYFKSQRKPVRFERMIARSRGMEKVLDRVSKVISSDATVLIMGETGTGKELIARAIHDNGPRKDNPFVALNCAGVPDLLLESELFGYERGAFTGADRQKLGQFELADRGTILLDEIVDLKMEMQAKILRALQEREFVRLGGARAVKIDVRIIAATNIDIKKAVTEKRFREDLYYRLNVVPIYLPPLRERREDIPLLAEHFLGIFARKLGKDIRGISKEALSYLGRYAWPGNIRELEHMMERIVVLSDGRTVESYDLPFEIFLESNIGKSSARHGSLPLKDARHNFERDYIVAMLEREEWNQTATARALGIHRNTLLVKLDQLGIDASRSV